MKIMNVMLQTQLLSCCSPRHLHRFSQGSLLLSQTVALKAFCLEQSLCACTDAEVRRKTKQYKCNNDLETD